MENIIQELIKIDKIAENISKSAEDRRRTLPQLMETRSKEIAGQIDREAQEKLKLLRQQAEEQLAAKIEEINKASQQKTALLKKNFTEHGPEWEETIFQRIIGNYMHTQKDVPAQSPSLP